MARHSPIFNMKHQNTKRQRRLAFAKSCKEFSANLVGLSRRKRYIRIMSRVSKPEPVLATSASAA